MYTVCCELTILKILNSCRGLHGVKDISSAVSLVICHMMYMYMLYMYDCICEFEEK